MKKVSLACLACLALGVNVIGSSASIGQADTLSGNSDTSVKINPGPLDLAPDKTIAFDDITINGKEQSVNEKEKSKVNISDLRGSMDTGWTLKVKKVDGKSDGFGEKKSRGIDISLSPTSVAYVTPAKSFVVNDIEQTVASISTENIKNTEFNTSIGLGAKLEISEKAFAQTYKTTLVWNLTTGPEA